MHLVYPDADDDLLPGGKSEEQTITPVELGAEPVSVGLAESFSLSKFRSAWVLGNLFQDEILNGSEELGRRVRVTARMNSIKS
jgi:hypothetical protein